MVDNKLREKRLFLLELEDICKKYNMSLPYMTITDDWVMVEYYDEKDFFDYKRDILERNEQIKLRISEALYI